MLTTKNSLLIRNSSVTGRPEFLFAASGCPLQHPFGPFLSPGVSMCPSYRRGDEGPEQASDLPNIAQPPAFRQDSETRPGAARSPAASRTPSPERAPTCLPAGGQVPSRERVRPLGHL